MNRPHIWRFDQTEEPSAAIVGSKAFNLLRLIESGFRVPPGFCITTTAYEEHIARNKLGNLQPLGRSADHSIERALKQFRDEIIDSAIDVQLEREIASALDIVLGATTVVAVRSSAIGEDLQSASFAGQQKTYLGIVGVSAVIKAVKACWASLWTTHAAAYRKLKSPNSRISMAVIVQQMVDAEVSGVTFTRDPVGQERAHLVVEATWGIGQVLVSGEISPDRFIFRRGNGFELVERRLGSKTHAFALDPADGLRRVALPIGKRVVVALTDEGALDIARECYKVEQAFGKPQDIEWAMAAARLYILQSRPITAYTGTPPGITEVHGDAEHKRN